LTMPWVHTPHLFYYAEAEDITDELAAQGIILTQAQAQELARAKLGPPERWTDQEFPPLTDEQTRTMRRVRDEHSLLTRLDQGGG
jgi:hypothetical protein